MRQTYQTHRRLGWATALLTAMAAAGCSRTAPISAPAAVPTVTAPAVTSSGAPRDPHVSPMAPEDQEMMKQTNEKNEKLGAPP